MKTSALKKAIDSFYELLYSGVWTPAPAPTHGSYPESPTETILRNTKNLTGLALWGFLRSIFFLKEPLEVEVIRDFYNHIQDRDTDRDLTNQELFSLFEKFYFNENAFHTSFYNASFLGKNPYFELPYFRMELESAVGSDKIDTIKNLKIGNNFSLDNFNQLLVRPSQVQATASSALSTTALTNNTLGATGVTIVSAVRPQQHHLGKHRRDESESPRNQSSFDLETTEQSLVDADNDESPTNREEKRRRM